MIVRAHRIALFVLILSCAGCTTARYDPAQASVPYPAHLRLVETTDAEGRAISRPRSVDIQVFREGESIEIVNATTRAYHDFTLWINRRYSRVIDELPAGGWLRLSLRGFYDERGEALPAGGFWRTEDARPIRLVEIQVDDTQPLIGLITVVPRSERQKTRVRR